MAINWRQKFRQWERRSDFVEVHPDVFTLVLKDVERIDQEREVLANLFIVVKAFLYDDEYRGDEVLLATAYQLCRTKLGKV